MLDLLLQGTSNRPTWQWSGLTGVAPAGSTFTRASTATYYNASGVLVTASSGAIRFDTDPATLTPLGYLAELASTNGLVRSEALDNASWTKQAATVTADQVAAPDGNTTGDLVTESATTAGHEVYQTVTLTTDTYAAASAFFKANTRSKFFINIQGAANNYATAVFDLTGVTASQTSVGGTSGTISSTQIQSVGGGWYRCAIIAKITGANPLNVFGLATAATGNTINAGGEVQYAGNGTSSGYIWGAQADAANVGLTSYISTVAATASRAADVLTLPLTAMPGWNPNVGGVLVATYRLYTTIPTINQNPIYISDGGTNNLDMRAQSGTQAGINSFGFLMRSTSIQINIGSGLPGSPVPTAYLRRRQAVGYGLTRGLLAIDGLSSTSLLASSGTYLLPVGMTTFNVGGNANNSVTGALESVAYYAGQRSDAFVIGASRG